MNITEVCFDISGSFSPEHFYQMASGTKDREGQKEGKNIHSTITQIENSLGRNLEFLIASYSSQTLAQCLVFSNTSQVFVGLALLQISSIQMKDIYPDYYGSASRILILLRLLRSTTVFNLGTLPLEPDFGYSFLCPTLSPHTYCVISLVRPSYNSTICGIYFCASICRVASQPDQSFNSSLLTRTQNLFIGLPPFSVPYSLHILTSQYIQLTF